MKLLDKFKALPEKLAVMSPRKLVFLAFILSVIVASIIYIILTGFLTPRQEGAVVPQYQNVVVAAVDIPERTRITKDMLKTINVPKDVVSQDAVHTIGDAVGKAAAVRIMKEDIITGQKLTGGNGFSGTIPDNMRAITIPINDLTGVAGLVKPGDYVDIFMISTNKAYKNAVYGKLILQNVLLLAVNTSFNNVQGTDAKDAKDNKDKQQQPAGKLGMVTIAVQPSDVMRVQGALQEGILYLALRPDLPSESYTVVPDYFQYMAGGQEEPKQQQPSQPVQPATAPMPYYPPAQAQVISNGSSGYSDGGGRGIEVIRGNSVSQVRVQ
ncbi:Flp pilus assembly protein CpaB [Megasphaera paucivorans]|uniref:Pilus assembly protein CpaB n=1 Tax=Megasphaera paucivorans TaxID=349095 RepID=A0A1G9WNA1_9FIRM|nr:Flp pilus assembly protein CpaB [Megasphaera paucivorans]SDM85693.1 pilus assembly protein CpaB [Megasphaera paucivorans]